MPPLLKSLSTCATYPIRNLVYLSKSEWFCGLGAELCMVLREEMGHKGGQVTMHVLL